MVMNTPEIVNLFIILKDLFSNNEIIYVSTPINTGERFIHWHKSLPKNVINNQNTYKNLRAQYVVEPNINDAKSKILNIRKSTGKIIIDPTTFESEILEWTQDEFYSFWDKIIKELANETIFLDGWEYSIGCCHELLSSIESKVNIYNENMKILDLNECVIKLEKSVNLYKEYKIPGFEKLYKILNKVKESNKEDFHDILKDKKDIYKDEKLDTLIKNNISNIAQFISIGPNPSLPIRFFNVRRLNTLPKNLNKNVIKQLINSAPSKSVNIRSFHPNKTKGNILILNKKTKEIDEIYNIIKENSINGKYSIINENIDIKDCGVSGVALGNVIEFSPEDTPKCVDNEGICSLPREIALKVLKTVYNFEPDINFNSNYRIEFSIHPERQGVKNQHTVIWEYEESDKFCYERRIKWPNNFSKFIGDKVFGLLIANSIGILVPQTSVISRKIAPFTFGTCTTLKEKWIRTAPSVKSPGLYFTGNKWQDPYVLMNKEEENSNHFNIASIISQQAVDSKFSGGAFLGKKEKDDIIEGVRGIGDKFMLGKKSKGKLPKYVILLVKVLLNQLRNYYDELGNVSIEWACDGTNVWLLQLNQLEFSFSDEQIIYYGKVNKYIDIHTSDGLDFLKKKILEIKDSKIGINLIGNVGITSHFGDLLRQYKIPSKITNI